MYQLLEYIPSHHALHNLDFEKKKIGNEGQKQNPVKLGVVLSTTRS